ncbi:MAG: polysaccharide biosynthesis/export family protein [Acidobacteriota bacterium]
MIEKICRVICLIVVLALTTNAQEKATNPAVEILQKPSAIPSTTGESVEYVIGPGDVIDIRVLLQPELSGKVRIGEKGFISLPYIGEVKAAGHTVASLSETLKKELTKILIDPQVAVQIEEYGSQRVTVLGAVTRPGRYELRRPERILDIIGLTGGTTDRAGRFIYLIRRSEETTDQSASDSVLEANDNSLTSSSNFDTIDLDQLLRGNAQLNRPVRDGDVIYVPDADLVFIAGSVQKPGAVVMRIPVPLSQAIAIAGGTSPGAKKERISIYRTEPGSTKRKEILVSLTDIMKNKAEDPFLQPNDVVVVRDAAGRNAGITALKTFTTALSISFGGLIVP